MDFFFFFYVATPSILRIRNELQTRRGEIFRKHRSSDPSNLLLPVEAGDCREGALKLTAFFKAQDYAVEQNI